MITSNSGIKYVVNTSISRLITLFVSVAVSWDSERWGCIGKSKYCEWSPATNHYRDLKANCNDVGQCEGIKGTCLSDCTNHCSNYYCNGHCFKSWGWYKGFVKKTNGDDNLDHYKYNTCK